MMRRRRIITRPVGRRAVLRGPWGRRHWIGSGVVLLILCIALFACRGPQILGLLR
jgi:hypothetical protein